jgi:hypothetical protein
MNWRTSARPSPSAQRPDPDLRSSPGFRDSHLSVNALMESMVGLFKTECIRTTVLHAGPFKTLSDVEYATAGWVD